MFEKPKAKTQTRIERFRKIMTILKAAGSGGVMKSHFAPAGLNSAAVERWMTLIKEIQAAPEIMEERIGGKHARVIRYIIKEEREGMPAFFLSEKEMAFILAKRQRARDVEADRAALELAQSMLPKLNDD